MTEPASTSHTTPAEPATSDSPAGNTTGDTTTDQPGLTARQLIEQLSHADPDKIIYVRIVTDFGRVEGQELRCAWRDHDADLHIRVF
jgi:hypothetical protein